MSVGMLPVRSLMSSVIGIRLGASGLAELEASHSTWQLARRWVLTLPELVCDAPIIQGPFKLPLPGVPGRAGACSQQGPGSGRPVRCLVTNYPKPELGPAAPAPAGPNFGIRRATFKFR